MLRTKCLNCFFIDSLEFPVCFIEKTKQNKTVFLSSWIFDFKLHIGKSIFMYIFDSYIKTEVTCLKITTP